MIDDTRVVAILPARGGSKRLFRKNLRDILPGVSLLDFAVRKLLKSRYVDEIVVSTEDPEILDKAFNLSLVSRTGKKVVAHHRAEEFSQDGTLIMEVVRHVLESYKSFAGVVLVHQVDHPMTKTADFDLALERLDTSDGVSAVVSVNQDGRQNGAIRVISSAVIGKKCLEYVIATVRTEYPQIDIHTEYDLLEAVGTVYSVGGEKW